MENTGGSLSEILQRTPMLIAIGIALLVGYVVGGTRQEEKRRWAETQAKVFEEQSELLTSCTNERNQAMTLCKEEKLQIANEHLELIRAYKERDDACRAAQAAPAAAAPSALRAAAAPPTTGSTAR